jgi:HlyD family secretion protein
MANGEWRMANGEWRMGLARRHRWLRAIVWTLAIVALASVLVLRVLSAPARTRAKEEGLEASGVIRAQEARIASEYGGRIASIPAREGKAVAAGDVLVQLDTTLIDAQIEAARAAIALAEARLAQVRAGARPGQVALAEAQLAQAEAGRVAAVQAVSDTMALVANPQHIRLQIAVAQAQVEAEERRLARALALKDAAEIGKDEFQKGQDKIEDAGGSGRHKVPVPGIPGAFYEYTVPSLPLEMHLMPNVWWQAWIGVNAVAAQKEGLEASLAHLYAVQAHPQDLEAQVDQALSALAQAEAQVATAQARVDGLQAGPTREQIAALEARAAQARAASDSLRSRRAMMEIVSPVDGVVVDVAAHAGEVAAPGATLLTISNLAQVRLTVYLPETQIGRVCLGQRVQVSVDSFPDRVFEGRVTHVADRAEFTPRNVATKEERINLVFAVEIGLPNEDGALKPGMPADAVLGK